MRADHWAGKWVDSMVAARADSRVAYWADLKADV